MMKKDASRTLLGQPSQASLHKNDSQTSLINEFQTLKSNLKQTYITKIEEILSDLVTQ
jgi:hypothetical protein